MLSIELVREVPEEMKPRKIQIGGSSAERISDQSAGKDDQQRRAA